MIGAQSHEALLDFAANPLRLAVVHLPRGRGAVFMRGLVGMRLLR